MTSQEFKNLAHKSKYNAVRCEIDGHKFDSKIEAEYYRELKADPTVLHVDVHPTVTLAGGVRFRPDFLVWRGTLEGNRQLHRFEVAPGMFEVVPEPWDKSFKGYLEVIEIKGVITPDFRTKRKLFDQFHPLAPLKVFRKTRKGWEAI